MKSYVKGVITGLLIGAVVSAIPAVAENIDALFNAVRININGVDEIQWYEDITLSNGETAPASILYNGTTYLPMRKLGELSGQKIYWNGDSKTVSMTGAQRDSKVIAEKPDKNRNVWTYYTFTDNNGNNFLGVEDKARGYERVYRMLNDAVKVTDDALYFVRNDDSFDSATPVKLLFENDKNSQDGTAAQTISESGYAYTVRGIGGYIYDACFEGDYMFVCGQTPGNGAHAFIMAYNYLNEKHYDIYFDDEWWTRADDISAKTEGDKIIVNFSKIYGGGELNYEIIYDKTTNTFGELTRIDKEE